MASCRCRLGIKPPLKLNCLSYWPVMFVCHLSVMLALVAKWVKVLLSRYLKSPILASQCCRWWVWYWDWAYRVCESFVSYLPRYDPGCCWGVKPSQTKHVIITHLTSTSEFRVIHSYFFSWQSALRPRWRHGWRKQTGPNSRMWWASSVLTTSLWSSYQQPNGKNSKSQVSECNYL